jgi:hypothetical protein
MAGKKDSKIQQLNSNQLNSAAVERILKGRGKMLYLNKLPPVLRPNQLKEHYLFYRLFKEVEEEHLASHEQSKS